MAKKTASFSLENDVIQKIDKVKSDLELSSRSIALERIILAYENSNNTGIDKETLKTLIREVITESNDIEPIKEDNRSNIIKSTIKDAFNDMSD